MFPQKKLEIKTNPDNIRDNNLKYKASSKLSVLQFQILISPLP